MLVLIFGASCPDLSQQAKDCSLGGAGYTARGPNGVAFHKGTDDLGSPLLTQPVHSIITHDRSSIVNSLDKIFAKMVDIPVDILVDIMLPL
jgi:hypothetical protein